MNKRTALRITLPALLAALLVACAAPPPADVERETEPVAAMPAELAESESVAVDAAAPSVSAAKAYEHRGDVARRKSGLMVYPITAEPANTENYGHYDDNPIKRALETPVSTFSIDVDTGAYANMRRFLNQGQLPVQDAVRVEELINYFSYDYPLPADKTQPFSVSTELAPTPWNAETQL